MWKEGSVLWHLNMCSNATDLLGFVHLFWMAGRSKLETLDMANMTQQWMCAPTWLLLFVLANRVLRQLDMRGAIFGTGVDEREVALRSPLSRAITVHPLLHAFFLDPKQYRSAPDRPNTTWTHLLYRALTNEDLGGEGKMVSSFSFSLAMQEREITEWAGLMTAYSSKRLDARVPV